MRRAGKVKLMIYANQILRAAIGAQQTILAEIKKAGGIHTVDGGIPPVSRVFELQDVSGMKKDEQKYLR